MSTVRSRLVRLFVPLTLLLAAAAPSADRTPELARDLDFSALDGSLRDLDGSVDGVWIVPHSLVLEGRLTCGVAAADCRMEIEVRGDLVVQPGAGIEAVGGLRLEAAGDLVVRESAFIVAEGGEVALSSRGRLAVDGLVSAGGSGGKRDQRASVTMQSLAGPGKGVRVGTSGTVLSSGGSRGGSQVRLAGCGIEVLGLVAAVGGGPEATVMLDSCDGVAVDGRDLGQATGDGRGRLEVQGAAGSAIQVVAESAVVLDGAELRVSGQGTQGIEVTSEGGGVTWRDGRGAVGDGGFEGRSAPGRIRLSACEGVRLDGTRLTPTHAVEVQGLCHGEPTRTDNDVLVPLPREFAGSAPSQEPGPLGNAGTCTPNLAVDDMMISTIKEFVSCSVLTSQNTRITPRGFVTYRAVTAIELGNGFSVEGSAQFAAILDPSLNTAPIAKDDAFAFNEDSGSLAGDVLADNGMGVDSDPDGNPLTIDTTPASGPSSGALTLMASGNFTYTPSADSNGVDMFEYQLQDGAGGTDVGKVTITVSSVNDAPSFTKGPDQMVLEDAGAQTVNPWAMAISPGPADETGQTVSFNVTNDNNAPFASAAGV